MFAYVTLTAEAWCHLERVATEEVFDLRFATARQAVAAADYAADALAEFLGTSDLETVRQWGFRRNNVPEGICKCCGMPRELSFYDVDAPAQCWNKCDTKQP